MIKTITAMPRDDNSDGGYSCYSTIIPSTNILVL